MSKNFTEKDIPDLSGYVIIVTGGNSGIGLETTKQLALRHARVYIASRSQERVQKAIEELQSTIDQKLDLHFLQLDLLDLQSVKAAAARFTQLESRLDILINNAGIMNAPFSLTKDGYETQWQANYLSHQILTTSLLPTLLATAANYSEKTRVRVVNVTSDLALWGPKTIELDDVNLTKQTGMMAVQQRYGHSKQALIRASKELNDRYSSQGVTSYSVHPGVTKSNLQKSDPTLLGKFTRTFVGFSRMTQLQCTYNTLWTATSSDAPTVGQGRYFPSVGKPTTCVDHWLDDTELNAKLWDNTEEISKKLGA